LYSISYKSSFILTPIFDPLKFENEIALSRAVNFHLSRTIVCDRPPQTRFSSIAPNLDWDNYHILFFLSSYLTALAL
ncbi:MAG: hypothetical protein ACRC62_27725, partial [Microcoleus sp.]